MKKLTALILTLVMLISMTAIVPVSADGVLEVAPTITELEVAPGEEFTLVWTCPNEVNVCAFGGNILYDTSVFVTTDDRLVCQPGDCDAPDTSFEVRQDGTGIVVLLATEDELGYRYNPEADLLTATFTVAADAEPGVYKFVFDGFTWADIDLEEYDLEVADVTVTVKTPSTLVEDTENLTADAYQIRVPYAGAEETTFGFRFISEVNVENYTAKEFGTLVIPAAKLEGDLTVDTADVAKVVAEKFMSETTETFKQYNATMVDIKETNYAVDFTYRPYIVLEDDSIVYGEVATANILETITALYADLNAEQQAWVAENVPGFNA